MNAVVVPSDELDGLCCDCEPSGLFWSLAADCCPARLRVEPNTRHDSHRPDAERVWSLGVRCLRMGDPCVEADVTWSEMDKSTNAERLRRFPTDDCRNIPISLIDPKKANKRRKLVQTPVSVEKSRFTEMLFVPAGLWLFASLVFSGQVHAVAICGVGLRLRNRTSRFRFCAVAAR